MRRRFSIVVAAAISAAGCGTQTVVKTVTTSGSDQPIPAATATQSQPAATRPQQAKVGDTLTLTGNNGESMAVTVDKVMDPLPVGQFDQADSGQRFVGVQITLKNVGSVDYSDSPSNGATLLSNTNEQAQGQIVSGGPCGNGFQSSVHIAPGGTQQGCLPFEMAQGQTATSFQFTLNSGFANQTGQWSLKGSVSSSAASSASASGSAPGASASSGSGALPKQCSRGLSVTASVSCGLASNVFYEYYEAQQSGGDTTSLSAWSPFSNQYYSVSCSGSGIITCAVRGTTDPNAQVDLTQDALDAYTPQQASGYAASHNLGPNGSAGAASPSSNAPSPSSEGPGSYSHAGDAAFCTSHGCIPNFPNGNGYVVQCNDGEWSHSGGLSGACSDHGGES